MVGLLLGALFGIALVLLTLLIHDGPPLSRPSSGGSSPPAEPHDDGWPLFEMEGADPSDQRMAEARQQLADSHELTIEELDEIGEEEL